MYIKRHNIDQIRKQLIILLLSCMLASCAVVGPNALRSGRLAYNEAINDTNNQQMLMILVHNRYEERGNLLTVSSVTANVRITSSAGIQAGFGSDSNYDGNLVPFSGGFIYEENPTISYTPVSGVEYLRQLTMPLPIFLLAQMTGSMAYPATAYTLLISSVNGISNPDFLFNPEQRPDPRFNRVVTIMSELTQARRLHWIEDTKQRGKFSLVIDQSADGDEARVNELLDLVGLTKQGYKQSHLTIPTAMALDGASSGVLGITTRSVWDMVEILSAAIEVPQQDQLDGVAATYPRRGEIGKDLKVHFSASEPERAYISVKYRDGWFYIDERDQVTKRYFKLLGGLWSTAMSSSASNVAAPVLTVPVSR